MTDATDTAAAALALECDLRSEATYALKFPITRRLRGHDQSVREEQLTEVTVRRPKGKDMKLAARFKNADEADMSLIAPLTGLTDKDVDELDAVDLMAIGAIIAGFVRPGPRGGANS